MERFIDKPSISEIFDALASEETNPDWDIGILRSADWSIVQRIRGVLEKGAPLGESRIEVEALKQEEYPV